MSQWKPIPGFPGYEASDDGVIRSSSPRYKNGRGAQGLRPWIVCRHGRDAAYVTLYIAGVRYKMLVHRLVCLAWHGEPPEGMADCAHIDHDSLNNRASNLKWSTHSDNIQENFDRELRAKIDEAIGFGQSYNGPDPRSDIPF